MGVLTDTDSYKDTDSVIKPKAEDSLTENETIREMLMVIMEQLDQLHAKFDRLEGACVTAERHIRL